MNKNSFKVAGLALALFASPGVTRALEVYKTDTVSVDLGARMQLIGVAEYSANNNFVAASPVSTSTGNGARDTTRIFLFQKQNRLTLDAVLEGTIVKFEAPFGSEAYTGSNNLYTLDEFSAEIPVGESLSVVAGLAKMPWNIASATDDTNSLFTDRSELFNLFFNAGSDTTLMVKGHAGNFDAILGVEQGAPNIAQRYIPETLILPVPMFLRLGFGTLKEDPSRFRQMNFGKLDETKWAIHANGFWAADSSAGHGTLFSQMGSQAELSKGPFKNGNFMFQKGFNPFAGQTTGGGLARPDNQFWSASIDSQVRIPMGDEGESAFVAGAQWNVSQYIARGMNNTNIPGQRAGSQPITITRDGKAQKYNWGQITAQGGEIYFGYVAPKWAAATRVDVLLPDPMMGSSTVSFFQSDPIWEITFPALTYKINTFTKLIAETEFTYNAPEAVDTNGIYQLKTVPVEYSVITAADRINHEWLTSKARLMLQVAF